MEDKSSVRYSARGLLVQKPESITTGAVKKKWKEMSV